MTTLVPRPPYTEDELRKLYPSSLHLQQVQILLRHGERTPVSPRFQNAGLSAYWPYCSIAQNFRSAVQEYDRNGSWSELQWRRGLETFGLEDEPVMAQGPDRELANICNFGELTDTGRATTFNLGRRLRHLYVDQLNFMPSFIHDADQFYLRSSPIPRALESLQQAFWGMYPLSARAASFPPPTLVTRSPADETLYPNDSNCRRLNQLSRAFAQRAADRWNDSADMKYLSSLISKWMPHKSNVAVDSHPRLSGIMDTINSTLAHGPKTKLPSEFYDQKALAIIDKISTEEWFAGYKESEEYRMLGSGPLMGDIVSRMLKTVDDKNSLATRLPKDPEQQSEKSIKFGLSGCHDTTLAALMTSVGAATSENAQWPRYSSHVAIELFKKDSETINPTKPSAPSKARSGFWSMLAASKDDENAATTASFRKTSVQLTEIERKSMEGYYVRMRFNDRILSVPGCGVVGKHLEGEPTFCTLAAFKEIVDKFTPSHWKASCLENLDEPAFPETPKSAGY